MRKRKSPGSELKVASGPTSPVSSSSSSGEWPEFSSSSSCSSVSYSPKLATEEQEEVHSANAEEIKAMDLVGCPRCFMFVMLSEEDPKCPKCKSTAFLQFFKHERIKTDN
ncbi:protein GL2-INTERACTING REPRESSOR 1-like [Vigna umbellata]|uniref:protein GL2-INTERACTING REPRESSOR 1-like n=1 Tax=Vigna umbellata TaxID=87088 RepID=UPI001F5FE3B5|nr:protein GL2-INTERACTING REPRESSOR 1-like [Vigna umbellata]